MKKETKKVTDTLRIPEDYLLTERVDDNGPRVSAEARGGPGNLLLKKLTVAGLPELLRALPGSFDS